jgi:signal transduction histidine kinase
MVLWVRQQQKDLSDANADLEIRIEQRTAQLETANKRLSSEIAEKEDFLRAVSHDLNAPLRNISGMATMLLMKHREKFDDEIVHRLERIQKNVEIETDLIGELLELSRIKTRRQKLERADVAEMVRELRDIFESDLKSRGIELMIDTPMPTLICEKPRLRQVFQNLIDNAIKYMGLDGGSDDSDASEVAGATSAAGAPALEFYVRDTGIGIDPEDLDKVFFVFRRGKNTQAQNIAGKGVGLASVKSIIETYNGKIWVASRLGEGSVFRFTINARFLPENASQNAEELEAILN